MRLWRLSGADYAKRFGDGYGYRYDGRWNTRGRPVTYSSTGLVCFDAPEDMGIEFVQLDALPDDWLADESATQSMGAAWLSA